MTQAQWLFEAMALSKKEKAQREFALELFKQGTLTLRTTLIRLLGLDVGVDVVDDAEYKESHPDAPTPFVPLSMYTGRPEFLKVMLERQEEYREAEVARQSGRTADLDKLNEALMNLDVGDLEPIFSGHNSADPFERWNSPETQQMLRDLGISVVEDDSKHERAVDDPDSTDE